MSQQVPAQPDAPAPAEGEAERAARRQRAQTGEAVHGLWQRVSTRRAISEGVLIFLIWRLLVLVPITFWPAQIFPLILVALLILRFLPPVWSVLRVIATRRERMSRRFFGMSAILATACLGVDVLVALLVGDPMQPFGGPLYGPDIVRFGASMHHLTIGAFARAELTTYGLLLVYFLLATICTRLAQGGFLRFTMPSGNGRVTL